MLNRLSGLFIAVVGLVLYFWIIPNHTETVEFSWLLPSTLPNITVIVVIVAGLIQFIFPTGKAEFNVALSLRVGGFFIASLIGVGLMSYLGFLIAAPALMLGVMLVIGERRITWLIGGVIMIPAVMWICIEVLLDWPLP